MSKSNVFIIAISGCSSSGKTTLSRLLRDIWPYTFILHEDDFYWPDTQIPMHDGVQDWDCLEAINMNFLQRSLEYVKVHGVSPPELVSKEDKNDIGKCPVEDEVVRAWKEKASSISAKQLPRIAIIDGFLLFSKEMHQLQHLFDLKLFLRTTFAKAKARREARSGYVTIEGFWEDPPGYVDNIVWPNYVKDHAFLFQDGNVEGLVDQSACRAAGVHAMPTNAEDNMTECLQWACSLIQSELSQYLHQSR